MSNQEQVLTTLRTPLLDVMEQPNSSALVRQRLSLFRSNGGINHTMTLSISRQHRIPELAATAEGRKRVVAALSGSLTAALRSINVRLSMSADQILDLTEEIIDNSEEDHLAIEDVLLFLKDLITGKCGVINDRMDIPTFFKFFESYRQERHEVFRGVREEQNANYKIMGKGDGPRMTHDVDAQTFFELYKDLRSGEEEPSGND